MTELRKCVKCNLQGFTESVCPECGSTDGIIPMCSQDHLCICTNPVHDGIRYCPICGDIVCPCGSHDAMGLSRITGYLQEVGNEKTGWNNGKKQELKDRKRYDI